MKNRLIYKGQVRSVVTIEDHISSSFTYKQVMSYSSVNKDSNLLNKLAQVYRSF